MNRKTENDKSEKEGGKERRKEPRIGLERSTDRSQHQLSVSHPLVASPPVLLLRVLRTEYALCPSRSLALTHTLFFFPTQRTQDYSNTVNPNEH